MSYTAIQNPIFQPAMRVITAITNASPAQVTTSFAHNYRNGLKVRIFLPPVYGSQTTPQGQIQGFGMEQINNQTGFVTITDDPTVFFINIDTSNYDPFVMPPDQELPNTQMVQTQYAQVIPVGSLTARPDDLNQYLDNAWHDVLKY